VELQGEALEARTARAVSKTNDGDEGVETKSHAVVVVCARLAKGCQARGTASLAGRGRSKETNSRRRSPLLSRVPDVSRTYLQSEPPVSCIFFAVPSGKRANDMRTVNEMTDEILYEALLRAKLTKSLENLGMDISATVSSSHCCRSASEFHHT